MGFIYGRKQSLIETFRRLYHHSGPYGALSSIVIRPEPIWQAARKEITMLSILFSVCFTAIYYVGVYLFLTDTVAELEILVRFIVFVSPLVLDGLIYVVTRARERMEYEESIRFKRYINTYERGI